MTHTSSLRISTTIAAAATSIALAVLLAPFTSAQECLHESRPAELDEATTDLPYRASYEGPFPETTEGAETTGG